MDKSVYIISIIGVIGNIPQLIKIWVEKNTSGVSLLTWWGFFIGSAFWIIYGLIHKEKPIIVANFLFVIIQLFIILGLMLYSPV